jgi:hypothetical protein
MGSECAVNVKGRFDLDAATLGVSAKTVQEPPGANRNVVYFGRISLARKLHSDHAGA